METEIFFQRTAAPLFFILLLAAMPAAAQLKAARIFSDGVVLQREKPVPVWGQAAPLRTVTVRFDKQTKTARSDANGKWTVVFEPMPAGGPFALEIASGAENLTVRDVLVGEVWLCSGQSNMEWTVKQADNFAAEKKDADYPQIRHFDVAHRVELAPQADLTSGRWRAAAPETVGDFTAVGFFFAREIHRRLKVPVGLVHASWGGSQIEGWISHEGMLASSELRDYALDLPKNWNEADSRLERGIKRLTLGDADRNPTLADERKYVAAGYDFSGWHSGSPMWQWDWQGIWAWRGNGYMARALEIPPHFVGRETVLGLAESYSYNEIYINGRNVFAGVTKGRREIIIPRGAWRAGENRLVVKMNRAIEPEWFGLGLMGSAEDVFVAAGDEKIPLARENWKLMPAFAEPHEYARSSNNVGTAIYNGMIAPLANFALRGALWYQGEANTGRAYQYRKTFPLLIEDWRRRWNDDFYFFFVQLSSYGADQSSNEGSGWAELREAQAHALAAPKTGMAVTIDIGNAADIHPTNKQDVGRRLAAVALKQAYNRDVPHSGPVFDSVKFELGRAVVTFKHVDGGLAARDKFGYLRGFEIAGADRRFYYAKAEIENEKIVVRHAAVNNPAAVRYAWSDAPVDANLYNSAGFPAAPFRTDDWPAITQNNRFQD